MLFMHETISQHLDIISFVQFSLHRRIELALKSRMAQFVLPQFAFTLQGVQDGP